MPESGNVSFTTQEKVAIVSYLLYRKAMYERLLTGRKEKQETASSEDKQVHAIYIHRYEIALEEIQSMLKELEV